MEAKYRAAVGDHSDESLDRAGWEHERQVIVHLERPWQSDHGHRSRIDITGNIEITQEETVYCGRQTLHQDALHTHSSG